jgi:hypothetical protein
MYDGSLGEFYDNTTHTTKGPRSGRSERKNRSNRSKNRSNRSNACCGARMGGESLLRITQTTNTDDEQNRN